MLKSQKPRRQKIQKLIDAANESGIKYKNLAAFCQAAGISDTSVYAHYKCFLPQIKEVCQLRRTNTQKQLAKFAKHLVKAKQTEERINIAKLCRVAGTNVNTFYKCESYRLIRQDIEAYNQDPLAADPPDIEAMRRARWAAERREAMANR